MKHRYRILGLVTVLIVTALFVWYVAHSLRGHDLSAYATPRAAIGIMIAATLWSCGAPLLAFAWHGLLDGLNVHRSRRELFAILGITQFAKYIPGNVAQYIGRVGMSLARGIPARPLAVTMIIETLLVASAAVVVGVGTGLWSDVGLQALRAHGTQLLLIATLVALAIIGLFVLRRAAPTLLKRFAPKYAPVLDGTALPPQASLAHAFILCCGMYIGMGVGLILLTHFLLPEAPLDYWLLIAVFALAWVVGFVTPGAPGGLGIREALMVLMLAPVYTAASASVLVIALRFATTLGDLFTFGLGALLLPRDKSSDRAAMKINQANDQAPRKLRLSLIGPTEPFRGGIAQHTTQLHRALSSRCILQTISFHRQYPAWLYPGQSDREPGKEGRLEPGVSYLLDAVNPLSWFAAARSIRASHCSLAVISWWTLFWAPVCTLIAWWLRQRGIPVVFICHNPFDHDGSKLTKYLSIKMLSQADGYIVHSSEMEALLHQLFPGKPMRMRPPPTYEQAPMPTAVLPKRGRLEVLFFGFIRPYKGLDLLFDALAQLADDGIYLTVVGEPWCEPEAITAQVAPNISHNVEFHLNFVDANRAANYFARADLVVLPYRTATGSGVAALAYHYDRPVLATRTGVFPDIVVEGRTGYLATPGSAKSLAECLRTMDRAGLAAMHDYIHHYKTRFSWNNLADTLLEFATEVSTCHEPAGKSRKPNSVKPT